MGLYQVGDRVIVRNDLNQTARYFMNGSREVSDIATRDMVALGDNRYDLRDRSNGKYRIRELHTCLDGRMFEGLHISDIPTLGDLI